MQDYENQPEAQSGQDDATLNRRDTTGRSLGSPTFSWNTEGTVLTVNVGVDLPAEPPGAENGNEVIYQVWGFMQDSETAPNAVAWGSNASNMMVNQTTSVATPTRNTRTSGDFTIGSGSVKDYYAVQVTVRKADTDPPVQDDQTVKVFEVPAAPVSP